MLEGGGSEGLAAEEIWVGRELPEEAVSAHSELALFSSVELIYFLLLLI